MLNSKETLESISKQWYSTEDSIKLANVSRPTAMKFKNEIMKKLIKQRYIISKHLISMKKVVNVLNQLN